MSVSSELEAAADLLSKWGLPVVRRAGWATKKARSDIAFVPAGVIFHHTAAWTTTDALLYDTGNGSVKGPLCNFSIDRDGVVTLGAAGYANHAGINNKAAVQKVLAGADAEVKPGADDGYSANRYTVGVEVKCPGAYNDAQRKSAVALAAALVVAFGWDQGKVPVGAHKEITRRKPGDPGDDMAAFRAEVRALVAEKSKPAEPATPPPVKPATPTVNRCFTVVSANCQSYDGDKSSAAWKARAQLMAELGADVVLVQETTDAGRSVMCRTLGPSWRYYTVDGKTVGIMVNTAKLKVGRKRTKKFGTAFGHGAIALPLTPIGAARGFDVICQHTRPGSVATNKQKASDVRKGASLAGTWPAVLGGDFALNAPSMPGWIRTTPKADSMDRAGVQSPDAIYTKGKISASRASLFDPGKLSDHKWAVVTVTVSA